MNTLILIIKDLIRKAAEIQSYQRVFLEVCLKYFIFRKTNFLSIFSRIFLFSASSSFRDLLLQRGDEEDCKQRLETDEMKRETHQSDLKAIL